ncbi:hypothetical protein H8B13_04300 [Hymenobacter sp. BT188]|uniref:hypothetical protein n=1 Tax=Hymenobacter sp. BT188 TaxID=2763504 RepID=UPI00165109DE|nr:hypothetical protein [Hymenobacter sp. BT188]MBC6606032.1 hypothetical protein [Hymenobacter sp. BT188]
MLRLAFSALLLTACLGGTKALAQQQPAPAAPKPAQTAPASEQPATQSAQPAAQPAPKTDTPPATWIAAAAYVDEAESDPMSRSGGQQVAPGFTAAPTHRVTTDYMGRPLNKPFKRVRRADAQPTQAPAPATNTLGNPAAPQKTAPAKETQSGTSDW